MQTLSKLDGIIEQLEKDADEFSNIKLLLNEVNLNSDQIKEALTLLNSFKEDMAIIKEDSKSAITNSTQYKNILNNESQAITETFQSKTSDAVAHFSSEISKTSNDLRSIVSDLKETNSSFETKIKKIEQNLNEIDIRFTNLKNSVAEEISNNSLVIKQMESNITATINNFKEEQNKTLSLLKIILLANCGISLLIIILLFIK